MVKKTSSEKFIEEVFEDAVGRALTLTGLDKAFGKFAEGLCSFLSFGQVTDDNLAFGLTADGSQFNLQASAGTPAHFDRINLEERVRASLGKPQATLVAVVGEVLPKMAKERRYESIGQIAAYVAANAQPRGTRQRPWVEFAQWIRDPGLAPRRGPRPANGDAFGRLEDVILDPPFPEIDIDLRQGRHVNEGRSLNSGDTGGTITGQIQSRVAQRRPESELRRHPGDA